MKASINQLFILLFLHFIRYRLTLLMLMIANQLLSNLLTLFILMKTHLVELKLILISGFSSTLFFVYMPRLV